MGYQQSYPNNLTSHVCWVSVIVLYGSHTRHLQRWYLSWRCDLSCGWGTCKTSSNISCGSNYKPSAVGYLRPSSHLTILSPPAAFQMGCRRFSQHWRAPSGLTKVSPGEPDVLPCSLPQPSEQHVLKHVSYMYSIHHALSYTISQAPLAIQSSRQV